ncbi:DUF2972 domain-containing protein, partial [Campylobacter coli]|nr:DUF2972 domain-containing protein [Campylobacter coli]HEA8088925.1 DUF2972 domain-containing protein [Campylobacter coli]
MLKGCSGHVAFSYFLLWSGYSSSIFKTSNLAFKNPNTYYINKYQELNFFWNHKNILVFEHGAEAKCQDGSKLLYLISLEKDVYILTRDPLSRLKSWANHIVDDYISPDTEFNLGDEFNREIKWIKYVFGGDKVDLSRFIYSELITNESMSVDSFISEINHNKIFYIDFNEIYPKGILNMFEYFKDNYNLPIIEDDDFFRYSLGTSEGYLFATSRILNIDENCHKYKIFFFSSLRVYFVKNKNIDIKHTLFPIHNDMQKELIDISKYFIDEKHHKDFFIAMSQVEFEKLYQDNHLFNKVKNYIKYLCKNIDKQIILENKKKIKERDILSFLREHNFYRYQLKNILDYELQ